MLTTTASADTPTLDDERWQAVQARDVTRDGQFVFAVRSTGIYCRPSCPARRPRPEHVRFFPGPAAAERAGFRACRRCRPRAMRSPREELVERARAWIDSHPHERATLSELAGTLGVSPGHLQRTFTRMTGLSPRAYAAARRLESAKEQMRAGADVTTVLHAAGYGSSSRFYDQARRGLGMAPSAYRHGGAGTTIRYTIGGSPLGSILVAATEQGICAVSIGDEEALEAALRQEFPRARLQRDDAAVRPSLVAILDHLQDKHPLATLPLDISGTPFQRSVWQALQAIPPGERRSYGEVAASLGKPGAARAVASACAANPVALVIPCHRVVRGDGTPGGYRWGEERKGVLLEAERSA